MLTGASKTGNLLYGDSPSDLPGIILLEPTVREGGTEKLLAVAPSSDLDRTASPEAPLSLQPWVSFSQEGDDLTGFLACSLLAFSNLRDRVGAFLHLHFIYDPFVKRLAGVGAGVVAHGFISFSIRR